MGLYSMIFLLVMISVGYEWGKYVHITHMPLPCFAALFLFT